MQKPSACALFVAAALAAAPGLALQNAATATQAAQAPPTFAVGTNTVAIDVVVRDKKGRLVKNLTAADFELSEDGTKQKIESFTVVARGAEAEPETESPATGPAAAAPAAPAAAAVPTQEAPDAPAVLALVFDRMSVDARDMARKAALAYLTARHDGDFVGVFSIDLALHTVQNFTSDPDRIRTAIDMASTHAGTSFVSTTDATTNLQTLEQRAMDSQNTATTAITGAGPGSTGVNSGAQAMAGGAAAETEIARLQVGMMRSFESLERDQQGYATTNGLLAVVQGLQRVPGRKTIVFFSEGMAIPANVLASFQSVVAAANRANVAIYTMDAGGLRTHSPTEQTRKELDASAETRMRTMGRESSTGIMMKDAERNEDLLRYNPQSGLGQLADQTGGFMVHDTNDARGSFRQIAQDMRFHYVLGYTPTNENYDGRFRNVSVKVRRGGIDVHSRRGYFAVRPGNSAPVRAYEAPAIAALEKPGSRRETFPLRGMALVFPATATTSTVPVVVRIPGTALKYAPAVGQKDVMAADLTVVVRVRNEYQQEVSRMSQHYQLSTATAKLEAARKGDILFYRQAELPPGKYTVDAVAYDAGATAASIRSFPLEVPAPDASGESLSSLVVIDHLERVPTAERDASNPLYFGDTLVYPSMGDPVHKAAKLVGYYFTAHAPGAARKALLEIMRDGQVGTKVLLSLAAPDDKGRVQQAGALPLESLTPGTYQLRVSLLDGGKPVASRTASLTVAE